jgi:radical SAM protein with 4Fe4S-binding SPASM domain
MKKISKWILRTSAALISRKTSIKRIINRISLYGSQKLARGPAWGLPTYIFVEPTNHCNLKCSLCPCGAGFMKREKGFLSEKTFGKILDETSGYIGGIGLYHYGEPLLHRDIDKLIKMAKSAKVEEVKISTNIIPLKNAELATRLVESGLDYLLMCIEGITPETYAYYRRQGNLEDALLGIENIVRARKTLRHPLLDLQFIVMKHNEHQIDDFRRLAHEWGVDKVSLKNCDVDLTIDELHSIMNDYLPLKRENIIKKLLEEKEHVPDGCSQIWQSCIILWNGDVVPCCYDWDGTHIFGNVRENRLRDIWNNAQYIKFRKQVSEDRRAIAMCALCPEGRGGLFYET